MRIIRGKYGKRRFDIPKNITARPTTDFARENLFNVLENLYDFDGKTALDLFAGTGAISWEFASRGCRSVTSVESAPVQSAFIKNVKEKLGDTAVKIIRGDVFRFIKTCNDKFDFIFADPPYDHPDFDKVIEQILSSKMLKPGTMIIIEHSKARNYTMLPHFQQQRTYGSVNFSMFVIGDADAHDED